MMLTPCTRKVFVVSIGTSILDVEVLSPDNQEGDGDQKDDMEEEEEEEEEEVVVVVATIPLTQET